MSATVPIRTTEPEELLRLAGEGDHDAFAALVREHESMVYSIAWHFFRDRERAEEVGQEVFLQLYRSIAGIDSPAHLVFWLRRVTANRCIDESRRWRVRPVPLAEVPEPVARSGESDPLLGRRLGYLLLQLPSDQRLVITMRYQEGLEPAEIGEVVGMPVNTVKSHLRRGLSRLRGWLGTEGGGEGIYESR
jgi:RNA polymerase sigma-70 factor (ECF subfamily)